MSTDSGEILRIFTEEPGDQIKPTATVLTTSNLPTSRAIASPVLERDYTVGVTAVIPMTR